MKRLLLERLRRWLRRVGMALPFLFLSGCTHCGGIGGGHGLGHGGGHIGGHGVGRKVFDGSYLNRGPTCINQCATVTPGSMPDPVGAHVSRYIKVQAEKAEQDDFTIHLTEWFQGGKELGPYGQYHVDQIARRWGEMPFPVVIATSAYPDLDLTRRRVIVEALARKGVPDADLRVLVGYPQAEGMFGDEMEPIFSRMLQGQGFGDFGNPYRGFGGGFGGGGFGGGFGGIFGGGGFFR